MYLCGNGSIVSNVGVLGDVDGDSRSVLCLSNGLGIGLGARVTPSSRLRLRSAQVEGVGVDRLIHSCRATVRGEL